jgi:hypothetical protein
MQALERKHHSDRHTQQQQDLCEVFHHAELAPGLVAAREMKNKNLSMNKFGLVNFELKYRRTCRILNRGA